MKKNKSNTKNWLNVILWTFKIEKFRSILIKKPLIYKALFPINFQF